MKIITTNEKIQPVVDHIREMQEKLKDLEAELKQYKELLRTDYMQDATKIEALNGRIIAQIVTQPREIFQTTEFKNIYPATYSEFIKKIEVSYLKVS